MNVAWDAVTRNNWELFHKEHGGALQQSWAYGQALETLKVRIVRAVVLDGNTMLGIAQFIVRRFAGYLALASCTRGPLELDDPRQLLEVGARHCSRPTHPYRQPSGTRPAGCGAS